MRRTTIILIVIIITLVTHFVEGATDLDEILAMNYETRGGLDTIRSIHSMRLHGTTLAMGQVEAPMTVELKRPNRLRMEFTLHGMTGVQAFDGETAWMVMPFLGSTEPELIPEAQARSFRQEADFDGMLVDWQDKGHTLELLGTEDVEGTEAYKIKVTRSDGDETLVYLDTEHCIELMTISTQVIPGQATEIEVVTILSDYKEVGGVMMAHHVESRSGDQVMAVVTIDSVEVNPEIADERFTMPAASEPGDNDSRVTGNDF
jgi:outer membrane lipoprotein-sorting protein